MKKSNTELRFKVLEILTKEEKSKTEKTKVNNENRKKALLEALPADGEECIYDLIIY